MRQIQAVFLDRDGTIGGDDTVHYPGQFELYPYSASLIQKLKQDNVKIFSFTNQPGISRGLAKVEDFEEELKTLGFDDVYLCPHSHHDGCSCRKPNTGMLLAAQQKHDLIPENCVVIGDRWSDLVAAEQAGCLKILVRTGAGEAALNEHADRLKDVRIDYVAKNLEDAVGWLYRNFTIRNKVG
ncbi:HAD-IIIA family hydrolase [Mesobacillus subterraneus]|uniref:D,D-heptose 1,7-bisphosphate phosphatase n=1 Tax=Mesobacillus subterraneus TaxID=285983 RepID=A0A427TR68_9BACI|nr:HAD-IIIA family hydrolase [Mesobacillus subterraneus]RSD26858.1 HAD-IIIA family hydrolase [Mesobacillus subterraneus]